MLATARPSCSSHLSLCFGMSFINGSSSHGNVSGTDGTVRQCPASGLKTVLPRRRATGTLVIVTAAVSDERILDRPASLDRPLVRQRGGRINTPRLPSPSLPSPNRLGSVADGETRVLSDSPRDGIIPPRPSLVHQLLNPPCPALRRRADVVVVVDVPGQ